MEIDSKQAIKAVDALERIALAVEAIAKHMEPEFRTRAERGQDRAQQGVPQFRPEVKGSKPAR